MSSDRKVHCAVFGHFKTRGGRNGPRRRSGRNTKIKRRSVNVRARAHQLREVMIRSTFGGLASAPLDWLHRK
jgi:hypothetical protein